MSQTDFVKAIRRILNETRQDKVCREFLGESKVLVPFLGSEKPYYLFLGAAPVAYDLEGVPENSADYLEFAHNYFSREDRDKAPFVHFLPFTANLSEDYQIFGEAACIVNISPIPVDRTSEVAPALLESCWPRTLALIEALKPKVVMCHGSAVWKFLAGLENDAPQRVNNLPKGHQILLPQLYKTVEGSELPFRTSFVGSDSETIVLPLPNIGKSAPSKALRSKGEQGLEKARDLLRGKTGGLRVRMRKVSS